MTDASSSGAFARLRRLYLAPRAALLVAVAAPFVFWIGSGWAWAAALLWLGFCAVLVARDASAAVDLDELGAVRTLPVKLSMGVPNPVTLALENRSERPARLVARETPPPGFAGERTLGPFTVAPRSMHEVELALVPPGRGLYEFGRVGVRSLGPRGLAGWQGQIGEGSEAKVYPDITAIHRYSLLARRGTLYELGVRPIRYSGRGTEFESLREYLPGDTYRDIAWKATARRLEPVVRNFETERSQTIVLVVDAGRLMTPVVEGMSKLDRAVNAALLLAYLAMEADDHVGLLVFGRDVQTYLPPRKGHRQFVAVLEELYSVEGRLEEPDYGGALGYLATRLPKRALLVVFTDLAGPEPSRRLLRVLGGVTPRHLPLVLTQRNRHTEALASREPARELEVFESAVAEDLLRDKAAALRELTNRGALALDVVPQDLSVAAVNRYLDVKSRSEL